MFSLRDRCAITLLLALLPYLTLASLSEDEENRINLAKIFVTSIDGPLIDGIQSVISDADYNSSCSRELNAWISATRAGKTWALEMLDATSKIQSGILNGNLRDFGTYGQCTRASGRYNNTDVRGKHCSVTYTLSYEGNLTDIGNASITLTSSICVPSSCDAANAIEIANAAYEELSRRINSGFKLVFTSSSCAKTESEDFTVGEILTISYFTLTAVFITTCTICDFVKRSELVKINGIVDTLAKFSFWTNAQSVLSTKITPSLMPALQGIRFLCMCWVVLGHRYLTTIYRPIVNLADIPNWANTWGALYIQVAPFAVDTFFVISGFLMTYQYLKTVQSGRRVNIPMLYIHRYIRLTPSMAVVILFVVFLLHRVTNGPIWNIMSAISIDFCETNWWVNLLYVQNFVNVKEMCLPYSWYLAVDMQLFWISPVILYPLCRWPKYGLTLLTCLLGISIVTPAAVLAMNDYYNAILRFDNSDPEYNSLYRQYIPTYNRACGYFVGIFLGYEIANHKRRICKAIVAINWVMVCVAVVFCTWITHIIYKTDYQYNKPLEIIAALVLRPIWSVATAWVVYACTQGYGGFVTNFLSIPLFLPLSRLSYCIYLVHMVLQYTKNSAGKTPGIFLQFDLFNEFVADLFLSIVIAFFLSLCFESPIIILEKMLRDRGRRPNRPASVPQYKINVELSVDNEAMSTTN